MPTLVYGLIAAAVFGIFFWIASFFAPTSYSYESDYTTGFAVNFGPASTAIMALGSVVIFVLVGAFSAAYLAGALDIANGQPVTVGSFFKPRNVGGVLVASVLIGLVNGVLNLLNIIPFLGAVAGFFLGLALSVAVMFAHVSIVDRNLNGVDGIKASVNLVKANLSNALLAWLVGGAILFVGALLCTVGLLVAIPVAVLFDVFVYRRLSGAPIAPAEL